MTLRSDHAGRTHRLNGTSHCTCIYSPPPLELVCQLCSLPERRENRLPFLKKRTVLSHKHGGAIHQPYTRTQERRRVRGMSRTERETYFTLGVSCFSLHSLVNFIFVTFFLFWCRIVAVSHCCVKFWFVVVVRLVELSRFLLPCVQ